VRKRAPRSVVRGRSGHRLTRDVEATRRRLLDAARTLFAEHAFDDVTVRDICREARANLALVNYHFGDKQGLYLALMNEAIAAIRQFIEVAMNAPERSGAEDRLRHFVQAFLQRIFKHHDDHAWVHKLVQHELNRPTEAANRIIEEAIVPRMRYLSGVVTELLGCEPTDPRVMRCVASIHGMCLVYSRMILAPRLSIVAPDLTSGEPLDVDTAAEHVTAFSLAGIRAMRSPG
jgi:AcrR family transcriptional regulator